MLRIEAAVIITLIDSVNYMYLQTIHADILVIRVAIGRDLSSVVLCMVAVESLLVMHVIEVCFGFGQSVQVQVPLSGRTLPILANPRTSSRYLSFENAVRLNRKIITLRAVLTNRLYPIMVIEDAVAEGIILGMGNPLLDISATVGEDVLTKYDLESNSAILAEEKHIPLYKELIASYEPDFIAGGATQNSIRVAQWMLGKKNLTSYFGAIGDDGFGDTMTKCCQGDNVNAQYYINPQVATGTCAVLINGNNRSLVANLAAANTYKIEHLKGEEQWAVVEKASVFYISGFFLTVSPDSMLTVAKHANANNKTMCFNLAAPFLMQVPLFLQAMKDLLPHVDICFGNETEAQTLADAMGWKETDVVEIAKRIAKLPKDTARPRTAVITQGDKPTIVVVGDVNRVWSVDSYSVIPIEPADIVDTNGAGDAFVGGFLAGLAQACTTAECVAQGSYAANVIIQNSGCTFPAEPSYNSASA